MAETIGRPAIMKCQSILTVAAVGGRVVIQERGTGGADWCRVGIEIYPEHVDNFVEMIRQAQADLGKGVER